MSNAMRATKPIKAFRAKLHNRRVRGGLMHDGTLVFHFTRLRSDKTIHGEHIRLSPEAVLAMFDIMIKLCGKKVYEFINDKYKKEDKMTIQEMIEKLWGEYDDVALHEHHGGLMIEVSNGPLWEGTWEVVSCYKDGLTMQERLADCISKLKPEPTTTGRAR